MDTIIRKSVKSSIDKQFAVINTSPKNQSDQNNGKNYNCKICDKTFADKSKFTRHSKTHTDVNKFECKTCDKKFASKDSLNVHERIHSNQCPFQCNVCSKQFYDKSNLTKHKDVHKNDLERIVCETCSKSFRNKFSYKKHYDNIHRKVKKSIEFSCSTCKKSFKNVSDLKRHRLVHEEYKRFSCTICDVRFRRKDNFDRHNKYFHRPLPKVTNDTNVTVSNCNSACCLDKVRFEIENFRFRTLELSNLLELGAKNSEMLFENSPFAKFRNEFLQNSIAYDRIPVLMFGTKPYNESESTEICKKILKSYNENCTRLLPLSLPLPSSTTSTSTSTTGTITRPPLANAKSVIVSNVQQSTNVFESTTNHPIAINAAKYENDNEIEPQPIKQLNDASIYHDPTDFCNSLITTYRDFD